MTGLEAQQPEALGAASGSINVFLDCQTFGAISTSSGRKSRSSTGFGTESPHTFTSNGSVQSVGSTAAGDDEDNFGSGAGNFVQHFTHEASVVFPQSGEASVTIRGRRWPDNTLFSRDFTIAVSG